jgi:1-deoxy-D-xylulose-5-phosphate reductoisomerase
MAGGTAPAVFNGANEECVSAFLAGRIPFPAIVDTIERVVGDHDGSPGPAAGELSLEAVLDADAWARTRARELTAV